VSSDTHILYSVVTLISWELKWPPLHAWKNKRLYPRAAKRVILGGGVPLLGPQGELCGPSGYTPRGFTCSTERENKRFWVLITTKKKKGEKGDVIRITCINLAWDGAKKRHRVPLFKTLPVCVGHWPWCWPISPSTLNHNGIGDQGRPCARVCRNQLYFSELLPLFGHIVATGGKEGGGMWASQSKSLGWNGGWRGDALFSQVTFLYLYIYIIF